MNKIIKSLLFVFFLSEIGVVAKSNGNSVDIKFDRPNVSSDLFSGGMVGVVVACLILSPGKKCDDDGSLLYGATMGALSGALSNAAFVAVARYLDVDRSNSENGRRDGENFVAYLRRIRVV